MITSSFEFYQLRTSDRPEDYMRAIQEGAADEVWLSVIANYPDMHEWLPLNKTVPVEVLRTLLDSPREPVRRALAQCRRISVEMFGKLSADVSEGVRQRIAYNKKTPTCFLVALSRDESELVAKPARDALDERRR
jgi:hypothetical protein